MFIKRSSLHSKSIYKAHTEKKERMGIIKVFVSIKYKRVRKNKYSIFYSLML